MTRASLILFALVAAACATELVTFKALEPSVVSDHWHTVGKAPKTSMLQFRVNLVQRNLDLLKKTATELSDPDHASYGKWMTLDQVNEMVNPAVEVRETVTAWLKHQGCHKVVDMGDWLKVTATVAITERTLSTSLYHMRPVTARQGEKSHTKLHIKARGHFKLPAHIAQHVRGIGGSLAVLIRPKHHAVQALDVDYSTTAAIQCTIVPQTLEAQYNINNRTGNARVTQGVGEFSSDHSYNPGDLSVFSTHMKVDIDGKVVVEGPFEPNPPDLESTLDIQWIASTGRADTNYFWVVDGWLLEWTQDIIAKKSTAHVWSISWGADERQEGKSFNDQVDANFLKLGATGVTFFASSGDTGAPGEQCGGQYAFNPSYPASSPYVLSVGATMFTQVSTTPPVNTSYCKQSASPSCATHGVEAPADVPSVGFSTGGGFSVFVEQPEWQKKAVAAYFSDSSIQKPPAHLFQKNNRGYPDVGAIGWNVIIRAQNAWTPIGGTSASSPIIAGMIAQSARSTGSGATPRKFGLINALVYKAADAGVFTPVGPKTANNANGCTNGYYANPNGWSPVVGLGTMDLSKWLAFLKSNL